MRRRSSFLRFVGSFLLLFAVFLGLLSRTFTAQTRPDAVAFHQASYAVSNVAWRFDAADPTRLGGVSFDLSAPASSARVDVAGSIADCSVAGVHATCDFAEPPAIAQADGLQVAAVS